ncbi:MAG: hypothetical protein ACLRRT_10620 [Ruthenibacterium lactatiformans]
MREKSVPPRRGRGGATKSLSRTGSGGRVSLALRLVMRSRAASDFIVHRSCSHTGQWDGCVVLKPFCGRAVLGRAGFVLHLVWAARCGCWRGRGRRLAVLWRRALGGVLVALSVYTGFTLWALLLRGNV